MAGEITPSCSIVLVVQIRQKVVAIMRLPLLPPTNLMGKWAHSPSPVEEARKLKDKQPPLPLDLILGPSDVLAVEVEAKDSASWT